MRDAAMAVLLAAALVGALVVGSELSGQDPTCEVTQAGDDRFVPPDPYPEVPAPADHVWYGSDGLWTMLPASADGHVARKSIWWSAEFAGGSVEPQPDLVVVYQRLDGEGSEQLGDPATNAYTVADGDFMIAGIEPDEPGCWQATATYRGATLSYTYRVGAP